MAETDALDRRPETPRLIVVCGLPGVGKTTVAEDIADRLDGRLLRTDVVRKELLTDPDYTEEESRMVYRELFDRASEIVEAGRSAVLDGTFKDAGDRDRAAELSESLGAEFRLVKVECAEDVVRERIARREGDASDADFEVHELYREQFDAIATDHVTVDNSDGRDATARQVDEAF
ncbi:AAA family ATPase [Halorussus rarus]|uniref:AAA family ATPase n=1 Tax=Halorussus TaxID=1070314 RepID=UPI001F08752F|nr:AAA family ATPase [Halorussus rarus]